MVSIAAQEMAKEVLETLGKGEKPNLGKIARKKGYSLKTANNPKEITKSKSYKEVMFPVVSAMENERNRIIDALGKKKLSKEKYRDMIDGLDKLTKNIQLLNGGKTSNEGIQISWQ
jgi:hypothetical protein